VTPQAYLALLRPGGPGTTAPPRVYSAVTKGAAAEAFLTLHSGAGVMQALPYNAIQFIDGDERGGTRLRLILPRMAVTLHGRQLAPVFEALRTRTGAHVHEFDGGRYDPPKPGEPVITGLEFAMEQVKPRAAA
jgi:hypothetical protein